MKKLSQKYIDNGIDKASLKIAIIHGAACDIWYISAIASFYATYYLTDILCIVNNLGVNFFNKDVLLCKIIGEDNFAGYRVYHYFCTKYNKFLKPINSNRLSVELDYIYRMNDLHFSVFVDLLARENKFLTRE